MGVGPQTFERKRSNRFDGILAPSPDDETPCVRRRALRSGAIAHVRRTLAAGVGVRRVANVTTEGSPTPESSSPSSLPSVPLLLCALTRPRTVHGQQGPYDTHVFK